MVEQFYLELTEKHPEAASHISVHMLHPTAAGTEFFDNKGADGKMSIPDVIKESNEAMKTKLAAQSMNAAGIIDGLIKGLAAEQFYVIVDSEQDTVTVQQIALRMEDQMGQSAPRRPASLGMMSVVGEERAAIKAQLSNAVAATVVAENAAGSSRSRL